MSREERKRRLAQASVITAISTKDWGSRREALQREKRERKQGRKRKEG